MSASPTLASLVAAVRACAVPSVVAFVADMSDADVAEVVRTARTTKGAVWLATRAAPVVESDTTVSGRWSTALSCLGRLADAGDDRAQALLDAYLAHADTAAELAAA